MDKKVDLSERDISILSKRNDKVKLSIRDISIALAELSRIITSLELPPIVGESAGYYYIKILRKKKMNWRKRIEFAGASVYIACRIRYVPRTLDEIAEYADVEWQRIGRAYQTMIYEYKIPKLYEGVPEIYPSDFVYRFGHKLKISDDAKEKAIDILLKIWRKNIDISGKPQVKAAAAIYIACKLNNENKTQKEIANVAKVSDGAIRGRYRELIEKLKIKM
ncbi:MAG: hypothetical protein DRN17_01755 [Thermoplasmata archaeon]|nr:MAG: hypothetical protein DRN17_01755 [Thermoplasmata archaeon]